MYTNVNSKLETYIHRLLRLYSSCYRERQQRKEIVGAQPRKSWTPFFDKKVRLILIIIISFPSPILSILIIIIIINVFV